MKAHKDMQSYMQAKGFAGFPKDNSIVDHEGETYRLMIMDENHELVAEPTRSSGPIFEIAKIEDDKLVDAVVDEMEAKKSLAKQGGWLNLLDVAQKIEALSANPSLAKKTIDLYSKRKRASDRIMAEAEKAGYEIVDVKDLPQAQGILHRSDDPSYNEANWQKIADHAVEYMNLSNDPTDIRKVVEFAKSRGLDPKEREWFESLFHHAVRYDVSHVESGYTNGRHRTEALKAQGVKQVVANTGRYMAQAHEKALHVRAGNLDHELSRPSLSKIEEASNGVDDLESALDQDLGL